jgi:hypothetical protein
MKQKIEILREYMSANEWGKALRLAASWPRLGEHRDAITQAWAAYSNRRFYEQLGKDVDALVAAGITALRHRYPLR